jgi:hypothetical protein
VKLLQLVAAAATLALPLGAVAQFDVHSQYGSTSVNIEHNYSFSFHGTAGAPPWDTITSDEYGHVLNNSTNSNPFQAHIAGTNPAEYYTFTYDDYGHMEEPTRPSPCPAPCNPCAPCYDPCNPCAPFAQSACAFTKRVKPIRPEHIHVIRGRYTEHIHRCSNGFAYRHRHTRPGSPKDVPCR